MPRVRTGCLATTTKPRYGSRQNELEGDERDIDGHRVYRPGQGIQVAGIRALESDHPRVVTQAPIQLPVAHVNRVHSRSASLKQAVGEPTGRGPHIRHGPSPHIDAEPAEGGVKLLAAATCELRPSFDRDGDVRENLHAGLVRYLSADFHLSGADNALRQRPAIQEPSLDEQNVQSLLRHTRAGYRTRDRLASSDQPRSA